MSTPQPLQPLDLTSRFFQAVSYLSEWVKHIITIGSALMLLGAALLKDVVKGVPRPTSYVIAAVLVLFYTAMLFALWKSLAFIRRTASAVLSRSPTIGSGDELNDLKTLLDRAQLAFLVAIAFFALLAVVSLIAWAFGLASEVSPTTPAAVGPDTLTGQPLPQGSL